MLCEEKSMVLRTVFGLTMSGDSEAMENPGKKLKSLSPDGQLLGIIGCEQEACRLRMIRRSMESLLPSSLKEDQELVPGGDLRLQGNGWMRKAWDQCGVSRAPREAEMRKIVWQLVNIYDICDPAAPFTS